MTLIETSIKSGKKTHKLEGVVSYFRTVEGIEPRIASVKLDGGPILVPKKKENETKEERPARVKAEIAMEHYKKILMNQFEIECGKEDK